ncbi:acyl-CoA dehydrogenase family protein [Streptomyces sp. NPDC006335]|uniref:acyl-CoA dehydrogenase family protein n=1 Tax=Streptomyces sp. NPDC006335 TaxID=3156895 RepID=UPI0033B07763
MAQAANNRPTHELVADLERTLGDPMEGDGPFSFASIVAHEEREELPPGAAELAREWGFPQFLVPREFGGRLNNLEEVFVLTRSLARRNLTVAVMFGSALLGVNPVWLWGDEEQRKRVADGLLAGELACFAVSEPDHGSDLQGNATTALAEGDTFVLTGEKWPVGNATRGRFVTVFATVEGRGQTLLLVDKEQLEPGSWSNHPFVRTAGLRGHDLSGIVFDGARVPRGAVLGRNGAGLIEVLKALQITRTAIGALSIGTMDSVLRIGLQYAHERSLYGAEIYRLPVIRRHLVHAHLDLLIAECTALPIARALSVAPSRLSMWSSVVKYLVPVIGEEVIQDMARVLGARSYLREGVASGVFQKLQRDHAIASIFEGTTHVNLHNIAAQLPNLAPHAQNAQSGGEGVLEALFDWSAEAPAWQPARHVLQLTNAVEDEITRGWNDAVAETARIAAECLEPAEAADLAKVLDAFGSRRAAFYTRLAAAPSDAASVAGQDDAAEHCVHHAAASCLYTWLHTFRPVHGAPSTTGWLILVLQRLLQRLEPATELASAYLPEIEYAMDESLKTPYRFSVGFFKEAAGR